MINEKFKSGTECVPNLTCNSLIAIYNFSPAELRIAEALLAGRSPQEYAETMGVSINTVRTQLNSMCNKTDTHKQSELIALLRRVQPLSGLQ